MFDFVNDLGQHVTANAKVTSADSELVAHCLKEGAIVNVSHTGSFQFSSMGISRALRCASMGDFLIWPDGRVFQAM